MKLLGIILGAVGAYGLTFKEEKHDFWSKFECYIVVGACDTDPKN